MKIEFSLEEMEIREVVRRFVRKELLPITREVDDRGELPREIKDKFLAMELLKSAFPEDHGGAGGTFTGFIIALKELCYATAVPAWLLFENFLLAYSIHRYGSESMKKTYLPDLLSLKTVGALAFTETETGSDPVQLKTAAKKTDGGWILNGSKRFITHSGICDRMILFAGTGEQVTAFLVFPERNGYKAGKRDSFIHMKNLENGDLYLDDYFASDEDVIGEVGQGFEILLGTETLSKVAFSSFFVGLAERALDLSIEYANTKTHRDRPIGPQIPDDPVQTGRDGGKGGGHEGLPLSRMRQGGSRRRCLPGGGHPQTPCGRSHQGGNRRRHGDPRRLRAQ